jgi:hypothetical protein
MYFWLAGLVMMPLKVVGFFIVIQNPYMSHINMAFRLLFEIN